LLAANGSYAICNRVESEQPTKGRCGGWIHRLVKDVAYCPSRQSFIPMPASDGRLASLERRHRVYQRLLYRTTLSEEYRRQLLARGFSDTEIELRDYRSLPLQGRAQIAKEIETSERLDGVPGFCTASNERGTYRTLAGSPGLLIPVRAPNKQIRAVRIRPDDQASGGKYRWLSSANKPGGSGPEASCHVARPVLRPVEDQAIWITEGELKADISADRLGAVVISIPGVGLWSRSLPDLAELVPKGGRVVVALDADWRENHYVHAAIHGLLLACAALGYETGVAIWDMTNGKGLDNLLVAGHRPEIHPPTVIPIPRWEIKLTSRIACELSTTTSVSTAIALDELRRRLPLVFAKDSLCPSSA
jgi:hypothetical protein